MSNKITIDKTASTLLQLLRIALNRRACAITDNVDWLSVKEACTGARGAWIGL